MVDICQPRTRKLAEGGSQEFKVVLGYVVSLQPACLTGNQFPEARASILICLLGDLITWWPLARLLSNLPASHHPPQREDAACSCLHMVRLTLPNFQIPGRSVNNLCSQQSLGPLPCNAAVIWVWVRDGLESEQNDSKPALPDRVTSG